MAQEDIAKGLKLILEGIGILQKSFSNRKFTIDGRLVGDIGEIIAAAEFDIKLDEKLQSGHDGKTSAGRKVQIKATFKDSLTFKSIPDYYLGLKLDWDGSHEVIFNGPGHVISNHYRKRKGIGVIQLGFPIAKLRELSTTVLDKEHAVTPAAAVVAFARIANVGGRRDRPDCGNPRAARPRLWQVSTGHGDLCARGCAYPLR